MKSLFANDMMLYRKLKDNYKKSTRLSLGEFVDTNVNIQKYVTQYTLKMKDRKEKLSGKQIHLPLHQKYKTLQK